MLNPQPPPLPPFLLSISFFPPPSLQLAFIHIAQADNQCLLSLIQMSSLTVALRDPFQGGKTHSQVTLKAYEKAYRELKTQIINEDKDFSAKQTDKLKATLESLKEISTKAASGRQECEQKIEKLKKQAQVYEQRVAEYERIYKLTNHEKEYADKIVQLEHQHLSNCKRRIELSKNINTKAFKKLDIDERKSEAHEVFKWIIVALYQEPENKYYWPNFKEQAIEEDEGQDLIERLGKIDAINAKEEQRVKSAKFVEQFDSVKKAPELANYQEQVNSIYEIAKIFLNSAEIGRSIKDLRKDIEKAKQAFIKGDEENILNMTNLDAIRKRIKVSEHYLHQLHEMHRLINGKLERYTQEINLGESYLSDLEKISSYVQEYKAPAESSEKRDTCECTVY